MSEIYPETPGTAPDSLSPYGVAITALEDILDLDDSASSWHEARAIASEAATRAVALSTAEPQPAKVIVVTDDGGRERRYAVPTLGQTADGSLVLGEKTDDGQVSVSVTYPPGRWKRAFVDGCEVDSIQAKARRLQAALSRITMAEAYGDDAEMLQGIARECLKTTGWDEEDL